MKPTITLVELKSPWKFFTLSSQVFKISKQKKLNVKRSNIQLIKISDPTLLQINNEVGANTIISLAPRLDYCFCKKKDGSYLWELA